MKITYPHMGNACIVIRALLEKLDLEPVLPPPTSRRTVELGVCYSPEFACFPFKLNLGNFIEAHEIGADTILMAGGVGPCRFGYYAQVQKEILNDLGYHMKMVTLEPPDTDWHELQKKIAFLTESASWWKIVKAIRFAWYKARAVDRLEEKLLFLRPRVFNHMELEQSYKEALKKIDKAQSTKEISNIFRHYLNLMLGLPQKTGPFLRIGLVGEFFTVLEPFANYDIEKRLGELGVEVNRNVYLSSWINEHLFRNLLRVKSLEYTKELAQPYLNSFVGGHGRETVGSTVDYARQGYDGVIHLAPFTCMPEIVAHSILPAVTRDYGIPTLTLYLDEHSGEAGLVTRLEAFTDLMAARREKKRKEGEQGNGSLFRS